MNNSLEQSLIKDLLANEDLKVDWELILTQSETTNWKISQQLRQKIFEDFSRFPASDVKKIICFFALTAQEQIKLLPSLNKKMVFDFSDGDWITDKALSVLANQYMDMINSLLIRIIVLDLEARLIILDSAMCDIHAWFDTAMWDSENFWSKESLLKPEWQFIRKLSRFIKQYLDFKITVTTGCLEKIIIDCLHS